MSVIEVLLALDAALVLGAAIYWRRRRAERIWYEQWLRDEYPALRDAHLERWRVDRESWERRQGEAEADRRAYLEAWERLR